MAVIEVVECIARFNFVSRSQITDQFESTAVTLQNLIADSAVNPFEIGSHSLFGCIPTTNSFVSL
jgi:hypothetical protein